MADVSTWCMDFNVLPNCCIFIYRYRTYRVTAGETKIQKTIPKAINNVPIRILLFYIGGLLVIMSVIPWFKVDPDSSPFVKLFTLIGVPFAAGIVNFVVLTAAKIRNK